MLINNSSSFLDISKVMVDSGGEYFTAFSKRLLMASFHKSLSPPVKQSSSIFAIN